MAGKNLPNLNDVSRVPEELLPVLHWWQDSGPKTLAYVGAAIAVVAAGYFWFEKSRTAREGAVEALSVAATVEDYEGVVALNTPAAPFARLDLARSLYGAGEYEDALAVYEAALAELTDASVRDIAVVGKICALEALDRIDEAMAQVAEVEAAILAADTPHYLAAELILAKARLICRKGDKAQAERTKAMIDAYTEKSLFDKAAEATPPQA